MAQTAGPGGAGQVLATAPSHEAEAQAAALLRSIYRRVQAMLHPHAREHEPGGKDQVKLPLGAIVGVTLTTPATGQVLVYDTDHWENGPVSATQTEHGACLYVPLPIAVPMTILGPTNLTAGARTITAIQVKSDDSCTGTMTGGSFSLSAGGGTVPTRGLSVTWARDDDISATITAAGTEGTYIKFDWQFT